MADGWIRLHRRIFDNWIWLSGPFSRGQAWVDLLLLANHKPNSFYVRGIRVDVDRGQVGMSEPKLALRWKWSRNKLRLFLKTLEKEQQIKQQKNNITQVLTILNYEKYQEKGQQTEQQKDSRRTAKGQQMDVNNNDNKDNNENNDNKNGGVKGEMFNTFWKAYPRKVGKGAAQRSWEKIKGPAETLDHILKALEWQRDSEQWRKDNGQYIPHPATYLNQRRWEDEKPEPIREKTIAEKIAERRARGEDV